MKESNHSGCLRPEANRSCQVLLTLMRTVADVLKPTNGLQHEGRTKKVRIIGPSGEGSLKEVMFTQVQLVVESARHKSCDFINTLGKTKISTCGSRDNILYLQHIPDGYGFKKIYWINQGNRGSIRLYHTERSVRIVPNWIKST
jgi:hypothetical protein